MTARARATALLAGLFVALAAVQSPGAAAETRLPTPSIAAWLPFWETDALAVVRRNEGLFGVASPFWYEADAAGIHEPAGYDRVLVDPPCTDLGTLRSRPDARWRKTAEQPARLATLQGAILRAGAAALRAGGTLVYSTCTISPLENEGVVNAFLSENASFEADDLQAEMPVWKHPGVPRHLQTLPHRDATDGFFIARLRRRGDA